MPNLQVAAAMPGLAPVPAIRRIGIADIRQALAKGIEDFTAIPTQLVFLGLLYPVIGLIAARAATGDLLPLLFPLLTGLSLMGPVMAVGLYEISRRREAGLPVSWLNAFDVLKSPAIGGIVALGVVLLLLFGLWIMTARAIYAATMGPVVPGTMQSFADMILHSGGGYRLFLLGNLAGAAFAAVVLAISVVSFPMILDRGCTPALAVRTSLQAVARNPLMIALWGLVVAVMLVAGSLPAFVGLALAVPILGHATWHLYRRIVA